MLLVYMILKYRVFWCLVSKEPFLANNITDSERLREILLNLLSEECYILVRSLCVLELLA